MMAIQIKDMIINDEYVTIGSKSTMRFAMRRFIQSPSTAVGVVVDIDDRPIGILDVRPILKALDGGADMDTTLVEDLMSEDLVKLNENDLLTDVVDKVHGARVGSVVVVNNEGKLTGYFSQGDLRYALKIIENMGDDDRDMLRLLQVVKHHKMVKKAME